MMMMGGDTMYRTGRRHIKNQVLWKSSCIYTEYNDMGGREVGGERECGWCWGEWKGSGDLYNSTHITIFSFLVNTIERNTRQDTVLEKIKKG
jgi:hypothetical protein